MKMVQVTSEAKASPIMTALTRMSADMNIDHGDNSRSPAAADFVGLPSPGGAALASEEKAADGAGACAAGAACAGTASGGDGAGACCAAGAAFCCADDGDASDSTASADITAQAARKGEVFIIRSSTESDCDACIRQVEALAECRERPRRSRTGHEATPPAAGVRRSVARAAETL